MSVTLSINLPDKVAAAARAAAGDRPVEEVIADWVERVAAAPPVETLPDDQVLALSSLEWPHERNEALSDLLAGQRENTLTEQEKLELDRLMADYRRDLVRKAEALQEAV